MNTRGGNAVGALLHNGMRGGGDLPMPFDRCLEDLPLVLAFIVGDPLSSGSFTQPRPALFPSILYPPFNAFSWSTLQTCFHPTLPFVHLTRLVRSSRSSAAWPSFPNPFLILIDHIIYVNGHVLILFLLCFVNTIPCHHARNYCYYPFHHLCPQRPRPRTSLSTLSIPV